MAKKQDLRVKKRRKRESPYQKIRDSLQVPADAPDEEGIESSPVREVSRQSRRRRRRVLRVISRLIILAALALAVYLVWQNWDKLSPANLIVWIEDTFSGKGKNDSFPVELSGGTVVGMEEVGGNLAVLTDTDFRMYKENGTELLRRTLGYSNAQLCAAGEYALVAELGGSRFRLESRAETILNVTSNNQAVDENNKVAQILDVPLGNKILAADVDKKGQMAFVTAASQSFLSEVVVYSKKGKQLFRTEDADMMAVDVALSPDGTQVAVAGVSAEGGAITSTLKVYDLSAPDKAPWTHTESETMLLGVDYFAGGTVAAVGDNAIWVAKPNGALFEKKTYDDRQLAGFSLGEDSAALVLQKDGSSKGGELMMVLPTGDVSFTASFDEDFRQVVSVHNGALLLVSGGLYKADLKGLGTPIEVEQDCQRVEKVGNTLVTLGLAELRRVG